ncbi:MAG: hypothetical protein Q7V62_04875 [Actinomycetota bacterium]|nr:hypothetical protein [Actinomycetota bacterium]
MQQQKQQTQPKAAPLAPAPPKPVANVWYIDAQGRRWREGPTLAVDERGTAHWSRPAFVTLAPHVRLAHPIAAVWVNHCTDEWELVECGFTRDLHAAQEALVVNVMCAYLHEELAFFLRTYQPDRASEDVGALVRAYVRHPVLSMLRWIMVRGDRNVDAMMPTLQPNTPAWLPLEVMRHMATRVYTRFYTYDAEERAASHDVQGNAFQLGHRALMTVLARALARQPLYKAYRGLFACSECDATDEAACAQLQAAKQTEPHFFQRASRETILRASWCARHTDPRQRIA